MRPYKYRVTLVATPEVQQRFGTDNYDLAKHLARKCLEDKWLFLGNDPWKIQRIYISYEETGEIIDTFTR